MPDTEPVVDNSKTQSLASLKQQRSACKGSLTRIKTLVSATNTLSFIELECRLGMVESYYKQATYYQSQIDTLDAADAGRNDLDELYVAVKSKLRTLIEERRPHLNVNEQSFSFVSTPQHRLPLLKLPRFEGKYLEFKNFIHSFNLLVHNDTNISKIEKFNHLLSCLSGEALSTVKAFQVTDANYDLALKRLKDRYDNDVLIFLETISALFNIPSANKADSKQLRNIVDTMSARYSSLKSLGSESQIMDAIIIHLTMSKVDSGTRQRWEEQISYESIPTWESCCSSLEKRCKQLEAQCNKAEDESSKQSSATSGKKGSKQHSLLTSSNENAKTQVVCAYCSKKNHSIITCQNFIILSTNDKRDKVRQLNLCFNCLGKGHGVSECPSKHACRFCKLRHHSLIHQNPELSSQEPNRTADTHTGEKEQSVSATAHTTRVTIEPQRSRSTVILATAQILIKDSTGEFQICRVLLDSCSQVNLLTHSFARSLNVRKSKASVDLNCVGNASIKLSLQTQTTIRSRLTNFEQTVEFLLANHITGYQPDKSISVETLPVPHHIDLADPEFHIPKGIDALLGAEVFFAILLSGRITLGVDLPTLQETELGWIVSGRCQHSSVNSSTQRSFCATFDTLNKNVERLWKLEELVTSPSKFTNEQQQCEKHFIENVTINNEGRITVSLPFRNSPDSLGNSRDIALRRFHWLEQRLKKNPSLKKDYSDFLKDYERLGHMSLIDNPDLSTPHYFIPHHCVVKLSSETTKLRVVFDASCRTSSQISLNELLMVGPTIQNELFITLLRFRQHRYGLMADISKMYRQIMIHPTDRRFQLILWRDSESKPISTYMLNTVTYGTSAAPYLAIRSLQYAVDMYPHAHNLGKAVIHNDFYVDDMVTGADDEATLLQIKKEVSEVLGHFNMELRKWHCSHPKLNASLERDLQLEENTTSALGVKWKPDVDEFLFSFQPKQLPTDFTKRSILSFTASFFDPLGLINPIIVVPRIILQNLWIRKLSWDEQIPAALERRFKDFLNDLQHLSRLHIPRFVRVVNTVEIQVHGFCDASSKAYGCCLYLRCKDSSKNVSVKLLTSKARLAPLKINSLPRLELCSAQLLSKLWAKVQPHLMFEPAEIHFWSDSQVTLHWIESESSTLSVFVGNRVADIQNLSTNAKWHHISSTDNPADLVSRGCSVQALQSSLWLNGPSFLLCESSEWPLHHTRQLSNKEFTLEKKKTCLFNREKVMPFIITQIHRYSNHIKCLRVFAFILRAIKSQSSKSQELSASEIKGALYHIIWAIQRFHFAREITLLKHNKPVKGSLSNLCPFLDKVENILLLRVGGRLLHANLPVEARNPLLLPKDDPFVVSMVVHLHRTNFHAGPRALTAIIQQEFWIVNCKSLVSRVVHNCIHCTKYKPKMLTQIMGNLPKERVTHSIPFTVTGVDFAGPIPTFLKIRGKRPYKSYIAVFVCFASKAVHLEAVTDLSSNAFIAALKRFIGRRGMPTKIFCDNATNFVGADNKLKEFREFFHQRSTINTISSYCSNSGIEFSFIPPRAPHFGGIWESAVKIAKIHLFKTLSNARLTFEELATALAEIEAVMNSRPLTSLSTDPNDLSVLTPGELLIGKKLKHIPEPADTSKEISLLERWKRITAAKSHFWQRWHREYLSELQKRYRWQHPDRNLQVGDLVMIHSDNVPPMKWLIGRVIRTVSGVDGNVRVAEVKTSESTFIRPITKLALLPVLNRTDSMEAGMLEQQCIKG